MMDQLSVASDDPRQAIAVDACLASNIIEVGVDIDRLSLMAVVGQPKTTATYIQVTGRVGRRWWERPGLILTLYNPFKSRDRSHFEQFQSYHSRLYEQVEPTTATPFSVSAIERGLAGALITWARQKSTSPVQRFNDYRPALDDCFAFLKERCEMIQVEEDRDRSISALERARDQLYDRWEKNPLEWEKFPQNTDGEYLMLWPGQYATAKQKRCGKVIPSSLRQVDRSGELEITQGYVMRDSDS
jgi:superfamily II DNA/RNA helicase